MYVNRDLKIKEQVSTTMKRIIPPLCHCKIEIIILNCILNYCPVRICATELLCIWSHRFVYVCMYMWSKNWLFSDLLLENLLLSVICCLLFKFKRLQCGLLCPTTE